MDETTTTVDSVLKSALDTLGVPVERLRYTGKASTFITFQLVLGRHTGFADDDNEGAEYIYRVDIFAKGNFVALLRQTVRALKDAEFYGITVNPEVYEDDTGYNHVPIEIKYLEV